MTISRAPRSRGFTLIELLVTMAVVGLVMGLVIGQMGRLFSWDLKGTARKMGSTIRYLYNKSATEGVTLRLVLDLDESSYRVEGTSERFTMEKEGEPFRDQKSKIKNQKEEKAEETSGIKPKEPGFSPQESTLLKPVKLPRGVRIKDVYAEHQLGPVDAGKAYIYFFPQGYVERAVINLSDSNDEAHYSLTTHSLSGSVKIERGYKEAGMEQ